MTVSCLPLEVKPTLRQNIALIFKWCVYCMGEGVNVYYYANAILDHSFFELYGLVCVIGVNFIVLQCCRKAPTGRVLEL